MHVQHGATEVPGSFRKLKDEDIVLSFVKANVRTMAKEMSEQTKQSILAQAAQAMLAQANQQPQQVLQLLR
ncbi:flagellin [Weizmannia sp. FSL W8-1119]|nr:flagellin [Heyndrickxia coagulans]